MSEAAAPERAASHSAAPERPRLLYIDDDEGLCRLVRRGLERRGFSVTALTDAREAVRLAAAEPFDAVALDHYMPLQDGLTTLAQLTALPQTPPVVYVTGSDESRIAVAALKAGASDYVVKSTADDFQDLLVSALEQAIGRVRLARERDAAEQALAQANIRLEAIVAHQEVLLREVDHRVANSLQLVASLVHLQAGAVKDAAAQSALRDTQVRISAIMQVHRRLYTSNDVQKVDMEEYLRSLVSELEQSLGAAGRSRPIRLDTQPATLSPDKAVSVGVVVAELVTNAFKYAYPTAADGEVRVALKSTGEGRLRLSVEDDGQGFGEASPAKGTGLGRKVIGAMARSLGSRLEYDAAHRGARAVLSFQA